MYLLILIFTSFPNSFSFLLLFFNLLFIYFWLRWVLVVARRIFVEAGGIFVVVCGLLSSCGAQALGRVGSVVCSTQALVEVRELSSCGTRPSCPSACGTLAPPQHVVS